MGNFLVMNIVIPQNRTKTSIPIADKATPSRLSNSGLLAIASKCRKEAIRFLSKDVRLIMPEIEVVTISTLEGG